MALSCACTINTIMCCFASIRKKKKLDSKNSQVISLLSFGLLVFIIPVTDSTNCVKD